MSEYDDGSADAMADAAEAAYEWVEDAVDTAGDWIDEAAQAAAEAEAQQYDPLRGLDGELLEGI